MKPAIETDLELANQVSNSIGRAYHEAVEFTKVLPSHALVRFRNVLEVLCGLIAEAEGIILEKKNLSKHIDILCDAGVITFGFRDRCHAIRSMCNPGAHKDPVRGETDTKDDLQLWHSSLVRSASEVRGIVLWVLEKFYCDTNGLVGKISYELVKIESQEWKEVIFAATVNGDPDLQYKAGLWCEAEIDRRLISNQYPIVSDEFVAQQNFLQRLAATYFKASYTLKPNVDASFRYARFVNLGKIDGDQHSEALALIQAAADAGHGAACDLYGGILYEDDADYEQALRYFLLAEQNNEPRAYFCLWMFYTQGKACAPQIETALEYINTGVAQDCRDSLYALGRAYFEGELVPQDVEKASELLERAANLGHGIARGYKKMYLEGGLGQLERDLQNLGHALLARTGGTTKAISGPVDPYEPCTCGSGKKLKFCCMKQNLEERPQRNRYAILIPNDVSSKYLAGK